jgi:UDP-N-acetylglucosamine--N-acetylmuramyl-(pentapeptide) pyrophosphoryl-undecaprenol N-acetylglucosamine transferase
VKKVDVNRMTQAATFLFAGGGSGGHLFPGVAIADELRRRDPGARIVFAGSERPVDAAILSAAGYPLHPLPVESLRELRRWPPRFLWRNWLAWRSAQQLLETEQPRLVIGLGGFASAPTVWAAARRGIPVVLIEQNVIPGAATRWLARSAQRILLTFEETRRRLPAGVPSMVVGNPVRQQILAAAELRRRQALKSATERKSLLILGGSQGAESLNDAVMKVWERGDLETADWRVIHQSGPGRAELLRDRYRELRIDAVVEEFFPNVADWYISADLVISRAGATTLAELLCVGCPSVLVPYPFAADQHQAANAEILQQRSAAVMVRQETDSEETAQRLIDAIKPLWSDAERRQAMSEAARRLAMPDAALRAADLILEMTQRQAA